MKAIINIPAVQHILYVGGLVLLIWCFIQFGFIDYKDYVAGHFPLHLVIYGVCPIAIFATGAHWYEYITGNDNTWYRRIIRRIFGLK